MVGYCWATVAVAGPGCTYILFYYLFVAFICTYVFFYYLYVVLKG